MDARTRNAVVARDRSVARVSRMTWRIGSLAAVGAVLLGAGFAHLLPTHLPHVGQNGGSGSSGGSSNSGNSGNSGSTDNGGGIQSPGTAPQQGNGSGSHVTSGGS
jgi:hypothetical protein